MGPAKYSRSRITGPFFRLPIKMQADVFASNNALLGEAPLWHVPRQSLFWLDILNQRLFEKSFSSLADEPEQEWILPQMASALAVDSNNEDFLWMVTPESFGRFSLKSGSYEPKVRLNLDLEMRTNDGGVAPGGEFWFGTMQRLPSGLHGAVYSISTHGELVCHLKHVGIPNTFCWDNEGSKMYLSDSYRQQMFSYPSNGGRLSDLDGQLFLDLSAGNSTPDGGASDQVGNLWNAQWDGSQVACYSPAGELLQELKLPVLRPTSCCFGGPELQHLFVTTASDELSENELLDFPLSGAVFVTELPVKGQSIYSFTLKLPLC
jgi:L-arabinonolactonase